MHDVIVFMLYVRLLNQMINPFNLAAGLSLEVGPDSWPVVSLPPHKLELTHRTLYWKSWECRGGAAPRLLSVCLHIYVVKTYFRPSSGLKDFIIYLFIHHCTTLLILRYIRGNKVSSSQSKIQMD